MENEKVILVNEYDESLGLMEKMEAHRKGVLHRAFSIFFFNRWGEMLLQQRAAGKYHSGGLWSNACCSHPLPGEETTHAALRRLEEELGVKTSLKKAFDFVYKAETDNGLTEYEFDHVFVGEYNGELKLNPEEVSDACYNKVAEIKKSLQTNPHNYTVWFQLAFPEIEKWWQKRYEDSD